MAQGALKVRTSTAPDVWTTIGGGSFATAAETIAGTVDTKAVTPAGLASTRAYFDVRSYGAKGDNVTNDAPAIQAAIDAAAVAAGVVWFPPGNYAIATTLTLKSSVAFRGPGNQAMEYVQLRGTAALAGAAMFTAAATVYGVSFEGVSLRSFAGAGHVIDLAAFYANQWSIRHCVMRQDNDAKSIVNSVNGGLIELHVTECFFQHTLTATVPSWNLVSNQNSINVCTWTKCRFQYTGDYAIHIENTIAGYCQDLYFADLNMETCNGGEIRLLSVRNATVERVTGYDGGTYTKDRIRIGKTTGSSSVSIKCLQVARRSPGTLGASVYDINCVGGQAARVTVEQCNGTYNQGLTTGIILGLDSSSPAGSVFQQSEGAIFLDNGTGNVTARALALAGTAGAGYIEFGAEQSTMALPAANGCRLYTKDNGSGKTQLMAQFATGSPVQVAIQP